MQSNLASVKLLASSRHANQQTNLEQARADYQKSLENFEQSNDREGAAQVKSNIAAIESLDNDDEALKDYNQALLKLKSSYSLPEEKLQYRHTEAIILLKMGAIRNSKHLPQEAIKCFNQALSLLKSLGDRRGEAQALYHMGQSQDRMGNEKEALNHFNEALSIYRALDDRYGQAQAFQGIGKIYRTVYQQDKEALRYFNHALNLLSCELKGSGQLEDLGEQQSSELNRFVELTKLYCTVATNKILLIDLVSDCFEAEKICDAIIDYLEKRPNRLLPFIEISKSTSHSVDNQFLHQPSKRDTFAEIDFWLETSAYILLLIIIAWSIGDFIVDNELIDGRIIIHLILTIIQAIYGAAIETFQSIQTVLTVLMALLVVMLVYYFLLLKTPQKETFERFFKSLLSRIGTIVQSIRRNFGTDITLSVVFTAAAGIVGQSFSNYLNSVRTKENEEKSRIERQAKDRERQNKVQAEIDEQVKTYRKLFAISNDNDKTVLNKGQYVFIPEAPADRLYLIAETRDIVKRITNASEKEKDLSDYARNKRGEIINFLYEGGQLTLKDKKIENEGYLSNTCLDIQPVQASLPPEDLGLIPQDQLENKLKANGCQPKMLLLMDFSGANNISFLSNAFIPFTNLRRANLKGAILKGTDLSYANLQSANLSDAKLSRTTFKYADLKNANLSGAEWDDKEDKRKFDKAILFGTSITDEGKHRDFLKKAYYFLNYEPCNLQPKEQNKKTHQLLVIARSQCFSRSFNNQSLKNLDLSGGDFTDSDFSGSTLTDVNFLGAQLSGAKFKNADLKNVSFSGADLSNADFTGADFNTVNFQGSKLNGVTFNHVIAVRKLNVKGAVFDQEMKVEGSDALKSMLYDKATLVNKDLFEKQSKAPQEYFWTRFFYPLLNSPVVFRPIHAFFWIQPYYFAFEPIYLSSTKESSSQPSGSNVNANP